MFYILLKLFINLTFLFCFLFLLIKKKPMPTCQAPVGKRHCKNNATTGNLCTQHAKLQAKLPKKHGWLQQISPFQNHATFHDRKSAIFLEIKELRKNMQVRNDEFVKDNQRDEQKLKELKAEYEKVEPNSGLRSQYLQEIQKLNRDIDRRNTQNQEDFGEKIAQGTMGYYDWNDKDEYDRYNDRDLAKIDNLRKKLQNL